MESSSTAIRRREGFAVIFDRKSLNAFIAGGGVISFLKFPP